MHSGFRRRQSIFVSAIGQHVFYVSIKREEKYFLNKHIPLCNPPSFLLGYVMFSAFGIFCVSSAIIGTEVNFG